MNEIMNFGAELTQENAGAFCSFTPETVEEKKMLYNAMSNPTHRVGDMINREFTLMNVYVESVDLEDEETGELKKCPRVILFDDAGNSYACVSVGVFSSLRTLFAVFGTPETWESGISVRVVQISKGARQMLKLEAV